MPVSKQEELEEREPVGVREKIEKGELAEQIFEGQVFLFIPKNLVDRIKQNNIMRLVRKAYDPWVIARFRPEWDSRELSWCLMLPPPVSAPPDYHLEKLKSLILKKSDIPKTSVRAPEPAYLREKIERGELAVEWFNERTKLFIPRSIIKNLGRMSIVKLAVSVYGADVLKKFRPAWDEWTNSASLMLPPAPYHRNSFVDPRINKLQKLILTTNAATR